MINKNEQISFDECVAANVFDPSASNAPVGHHQSGSWGLKQLRFKTLIPKRRAMS